VGRRERCPELIMAVGVAAFDDDTVRGYCSPVRAERVG